VAVVVALPEREIGSKEESLRKKETRRRRSVNESPEPCVYVC
jgi:hypothetical protein